MRVIITGGTGLIGRNLANLLAHEGNDVIVLSRYPERKNTNFSPGVRVVGWDAKTPNGWSHLLDEEDVFIINLAGENPVNWRWTQSHKHRVMESRFNVTHAVVQAIHEAEIKPSALIQASAVGYYGDTGEAVVTEDTPPSPDDWRAQVCVEWENAAHDAGVRTALLRIGIVLEQSGGAFPAFLAAADFFGSRLGDGQQWVPWIHNDDIAYAIRFLMHHPEASGAYNLTATHPVRNEEFMRLVAHVRGRSAVIPVPALALRAVMGEQAEVVLDSQRIVPHRLLEAGYKFRYAEAEGALRDILSRAKHWGD